MKALKYLICASILFVMMGCKEDGVDIVATEPTLSIEKLAVELPYTQGSYEIDVTYEGGDSDLSITSDSDWLTAYESSWNKIYMSYKQNDTTGSRVANITVSYSDIEYTIVVTQVAEVTMSFESTLSITSVAGTTTVALSYSGTSEIPLFVSDSDWIEAEESDDSKILFTYKANESYRPREATITATLESLEQSIVVTQDASTQLSDGQLQLGDPGVTFDLSKFDSSYPQIERWSLAGVTGGIPFIDEMEQKILVTLEDGADATDINNAITSAKSQMSLNGWDQELTTLLFIVIDIYIENCHTYLCEARDCYEMSVAIPTTLYTLFVFNQKTITTHSMHLLTTPFSL